MKQPNHKYKLVIYNGRVKIYIDGYILVTFNQLDYKGLYSYKDDSCLYGIDIYLKDVTMEVYFKTKKVWLDILKLIDEEL